MADLVKTFVVPGSLSFLVAGLVLGVALLYGNDRVRRWGRAWLTGLVVAYGLLSTPLGADLLTAPLVGAAARVTSPAQAAGIDTIVVLSTGGQVFRAEGGEVTEMGEGTSLNAIEAARLYRLLPSPKVIASGGIVNPESRREPEAEVLARGLVRLGIPRDRIALEPRSRTTREQAVNVAQLLRQRGVRRFILVTAADHMPRSLRSFRRQGLTPVPSASRMAAATPPGLWWRLRPGLGALEESERACYEYLARLYYWTSGWVMEADAVTDASTE